jgi:hypothetical protein
LDLKDNGLTTDYTDIFRLVNPQRTKSRKFPYIHPIEKDGQKHSVYSPLIDRNFLDNIPDSHTVKKNPEYCPMEKPPKKLLEQVNNIIRKRTIALLPYCPIVDDNLNSEVTPLEDRQ